MLYHTCTHSMAMMLAAVDLVGGGVLERFPGLTVVFWRATAPGLPWLLWRLDEHYEMSAAYDHPDLKMEPSPYLRRQCYPSVECDEEPAVIVSKYPRSVARFWQMPLSDQAKRKILWDNCNRLYGLGG